MTPRGNARSNDAIGRRLQASRAALGYGGRRQAAFAQRAGIAPNTYNQWEKGKVRPDLDGALRLVDEYHLTLDWIYEGDMARLPSDLADTLRNPRAAE